MYSEQLIDPCQLVHFQWVAYEGFAVHVDVPLWIGLNHRFFASMLQQQER